MPVLDEKLTGDIKTVYFEESPHMSTYLVAFVIGLFDYIEETTVDGLCFGWGFIFFLSCKNLRSVWIILHKC